MIFDDRADAAPCVEALWAGTLALMTTYAEPASSRHRVLIARKVVSNLFFLARHPALPMPLRRVVERAHGRWAGLAEPGTVTRNARAATDVLPSRPATVH